MLRPRFTQNDRGTFGSLPCKFLAQDDKMTTWIREDGQGAPEHFTYEALAEFRKSSQWRYERDYYDIDQAKLSTSMPALTLDHLTDKQKQKTIWYFVICMALKKMYDDGDISLTDASIGLGKAALQAVMNEIEVKRHNIGVDLKGFADMKVRKLPCSKTIRTKFSMLRRFSYNVLSLAPGW